MSVQAADETGILAAFSDQLAGAVERAGASVVQVDARRRQAASKSDQAVGQENDEHDENDTEDEQVPFRVAADRGFQERDDHAARKRAQQRTYAADE